MNSDISALPKNFSKSDVLVLNSLLDEAKKEIEPYSMSWEAPWLRTPIDLPDWILADGDSWYEDGKWHKVRMYHWSYRLFDGTFLTDSENKLILSSSQKIGFLWRTLPDSFAGNNLSLLGALYSLSVFVRWMYFNKSVYDPSEYGFLRIDHAALRDFSAQFVKGGVPWVLGYPSQLLLQWFRSALDTIPPPEVLDNPFLVSEPDRKKISDWLSENDYYRENIHDRGQFLDRNRLADDLHCELHSIKMHKRFAAFLRLFEPTIVSPLLLGRERRREFPSHKTPLLKEFDASKNHEAGAYPDMFRHLLKLRPHVPNIVPDTTNIRFGEIYSALNINSAKRHTPWMPLTIALSCTQEAIKWVHVYGDALVDSYLKICESLEVEGLFRVKNLSPIHRRRRDRLVSEFAFPDCLSELKIEGWISKLALDVDGEAYNNYRTSPSLNDAIGVLAGATIFLLGILKPIRSCEISDLKRDCISFADGDGYWITQSIAKSTKTGQRGEDELPIPRIVARALLIMDRLSQGLRRLTGTCPESFANHLLYFPHLDISDSLQADPLTNSRQRMFLDRFCDWLALPCDEYGRRWYVRIHECRKSFLITFFWCFRYASLDAARWIAGQRDARDIYDYIQANFPGMELPNIECQYVTEQLWLHEKSGEAEINNIEEIYRKVCQHFKVRSLNLVDEGDLRDWLEIEFHRKTYSIRPYSVRVRGQIVETQICVRMTKGGKDA